MDFLLFIKQFEGKYKRLLTRNQIIKAVQGFFDNKGFIEVQTGILQKMPGADVHIHAFKTDLCGVDLVKTDSLYLHNSPEFAMKKLLVAGQAVGLTKIYQIVPVFRNGESSKLHHAEFTMIEWYRTNDNYKTIMQDCADLIAHVARACAVTHCQFGEKICDPFAPPEKLRVRDAFLKFCDFDLADVLNDRDLFAKKALKTGISIRETYDWDDIFHALMAEKIEPYLGVGSATILYEYPAHMAALSRLCDEDNRFAKRFELYMCGVELANAFDELTDAVEQRARFISDMAEKEKLYGVSFPLDEEFLAALEHGLPPTGGIALGIDRLVMLMSGAKHIDDVMWGV